MLDEIRRVGMTPNNKITVKVGQVEDLRMHLMNHLFNEYKTKRINNNFHNG